jgi:hypothetical protein
VNVADSEFQTCLVVKRERERVKSQEKVRALGGTYMLREDVA